MHSVRLSGITPRENQFYEWVYTRDGVKCGSSRIIQEIKVYHDLYYTLCIDGKQVPKYQLNCQNRKPICKYRL